jgi:hypothetical protein
VSYDHQVGVLSGGYKGKGSVTYQYRSYELRRRDRQNGLRNKFPNCEGPLVCFGVGKYIDIEMRLLKERILERQTIAPGKYACAQVAEAFGLVFFREVKVRGDGELQAPSRVVAQTCQDNAVAEFRVRGDNSVAQDGTVGVTDVQDSAGWLRNALVQIARAKVFGEVDENGGFN